MVLLNSSRCVVLLSSIRVCGFVEFLLSSRQVCGFVEFCVVYGVEFL